MKKLRVWDTKYKEMFYIEDMYWFEENGVHDLSGDGRYSDFIYMWSTELKDKQGNDIYEKDIVPLRNVVTYVGGNDSECLGMDIGFYIQRDNFESWTMMQVGDEYEVLGNIFENPELLETK